MKARQSTKGFTLIELLIVIAIIGLLATLAIVSLTTAQQKARDAKRIADVKQIQNATELYFSENSGVYPQSSSTSNDTWAEFGTTLSPYITNMPADPTNTTTKVYVYGTNNTATEYFIGAELEATNTNALNGDDDTSYDGSTNAPSASWSALDVVLSSDTAATTDDDFNCGTETSPTFHYCASE